MANNDGWPEAFGFSIAGGDPVVISSVEEGGSAQQAGLQQGDILTEVDGEDVHHWSVREVVERARRSAKIPPGLLVMSRIRTFDIPRSRTNGGFGITLRGNSPVYIRSVDFDSPARAAGVRSGDLLLKVNGCDVRYSSKIEALELLKRTGDTLQLVVVAEGINSPTSISTKPELGELEGKEQQQRKAQMFHYKVNYYLYNDDTKQSHLFTLLRLYLKNQDVDSLSQSLKILLETDIERRLLGDIRSFINPHHLVRFDALVSYKIPSSSQYQTSSPRMTNNFPRQRSLLIVGHERHVTVNRYSGEFGFSLSGNAPVFIRSVDGMSPAAVAGIKPGEYILEINGLDVRSATHSHVVKLLKGSGGHPTLLLSSHSPAPSTHHDSSLHRAKPPSLPQSTGSVSCTRGNESGGGGDGDIGGGSSSMGGPGSGSSGGGGGGGGGGSPALGDGVFKRESKAFKYKVDQMLSQNDKKEVFHQLAQYAILKDMPHLISGLASILSDPSKHELFHYICQLLPAEEQNEFDHQAAVAVSQSKKRVQLSVQRENTSDTAKEGRPERHLKDIQRGGEEEGIVFKVTPTGSVDTQLIGHKLIEGGKAKEESKKSSLGSRYNGKRTVEMQKRNTQQSLPDTPAAVLPSHHPSSATASPSTLLPPGVPPPPPGVPPPPPPPPPPLISSSSTPDQPLMKRVNWEKLRGLEGTIWSDMSGIQETLEYSQLVSQFTTTSTQKSKQAKVKDGKPSVLNQRKAYNIAILLGHLKLSHDKIKHAILACDTRMLSEQHLQQLETFAPDSKECTEYARYYKDSSMLSLPDKFSCEMSTIPYYKERLKALIFRQQFQEKVEEISSDLTAIIEASTLVHCSKNFKKILELILAVGNYMNVGSRHVGSAEGFRIKYLTQLKDVRATDKKSSLLHFIAATAQRKFPQAIEFLNELAPVKKASRVSGKTLEVEIAELRSGLKETRHTLAVISDIENPHPNERFPQITQPFVTDAQDQLALLVSQYTKMKKDFKRAIKFFGEDPIHTQIDEFFSIIATFLLDFESAMKDNKKAIEEEQKREIEKVMERERVRKGITKSQDSHRQQGSPVVDLREELARRAALRGEINNQNVSDQKETGDEGTTELEFDYETEF